jgi:hypothetical protein
MQCLRHPQVETGLACGRCETPICPKCLVITDVGARCPTCAPRRKLPQFEIGPLHVLRGAGAAVAAGGLLGVLWGLFAGLGAGLFTLFIGLGVGYGVAEAVSRATNRKSGTVMQTVAAVGVVLAFLVRNILVFGALLPAGDLFGYVAALAGIVIAVNQLRY